MQSDLGCSYCDVQREPENSVIGRRLLDSSYDFNLSNKRPYPLEQFILAIKVDSLKFRILEPS